MTNSTNAGSASSGAEKRLFGHPQGLFYLFFAELWERFSFYGMRALLTLYMAQELFHELANGEEISIGIYAAYGSLVYATPVIGGSIADRYIGYRKSIMLGAVLMALGHFAMVFDSLFFPALGLLIVGNGFFKPNISTMVGKLYAEGDPKRDAGFTIFYLGINVGAFLAPLVCGWLGEVYGWHYGFGAAGIGMLAGLIVFWRGMMTNVFGEHGYQPKEYAEGNKVFGLNIEYVIYGAAFLSVPVFAYLVRNNALEILGSELMEVLLIAVLVIVLVFIGFKSVQVSKMERERLFVVLILTFFITVFWAFFEQAGSSLTLFANKNVDIAGIMTASQTNAINPGYIMLFAIPFSMMWVALDRRKLNPITPIKFALGIAQLGLGFLVFAYAARFVDAEGKVPFLFLALGYLFITTGELFISPIGLSKVTELSPKAIGALMMGVYFLSSAFAHHIAGVIAKLTAPSAGSADADVPMAGIVEAITGFVDGKAGEGAIESVQSLATYSAVFTQIGVVAFVFALFALLLSPLLKKWMHGVH